MIDLEEAKATATFTKRYFEGGAMCIKNLIFEVERLRELSEVKEEYIKLLEDEMEKAAIFLDIHGWKYKRDIIDKGEELRAKIKELEESHDQG